MFPVAFQSIHSSSVFRNMTISMKKTSIERVCRFSSIVRYGDQVFVRIEGKLENGDVFDEMDDTPQMMTVGDDGMIPGLVDALIGMKKG